MFENTYKTYIETCLSDHLQEQSQKLSMHIHEACNYTMSNGQRIRPAISIDLCCSVSKNTFELGIGCLAIEYIHSASLIIDDLPCMDNAKVRRHQACVHVQFGEAIAQLTAITLVSLSFDAITRITTNLSTLKGAEEANRIGMISLKLISECLQNASGGQYYDLTASKRSEREDLGNYLKDLSKDIDVEEIIEKKTGSFFDAAFLLGWICGGGSLELIPEIKALSRSFSMIYQILDDIEDYTEDLQIGKKNFSQNYAIRYGLTQAHQDVQIYLTSFIEAMNRLGLMSDFFQQLIAEFHKKERMLKVDRKENGDCKTRE